MNAELNENSADSQEAHPSQGWSGRNAAKLAGSSVQSVAASGEGAATEATADSDIAAKLAAYKAKREANNL